VVPTLTKCATRGPNLYNQHVVIYEMVMGAEVACSTDNSRGEWGSEMAMFACHVDSYALIRVIWTLSGTLSEFRDQDILLV
jgi:hypothetical protein